MRKLYGFMLAIMALMMIPSVAQAAANGSGQGAHRGVWKSRVAESPMKIQSLESVLESQHNRLNSQMAALAPMKLPSGKMFRASIIWENNWSEFVRPFRICDYSLRDGEIMGRDVIGTGNMTWSMKIGGNDYLIFNEAREGDKIYNIVMIRYDMDEVRVTDQHPFDTAVQMYTGAYDPTTSKVYVVARVNTTGGYTNELMIFDPDTYHFSKVAEIELLSVPVMMFDASGQLYWHELSDGGLYKMDKTTGQKTLVGYTGIQHQFITTGCIDQETGECYIANNTADSAALYKVDLATAMATKVGDIPMNAELSGAYIPAKAPEFTAPGEAEDISFDFAEGSLSGKMSMKAPIWDIKGRTLDKNTQLSYRVVVQSKVMAEGKALPGEIVTVPLTFERPDTYKINIVFGNENGDGKARIVSQWIGYDVPDFMKRPLLKVVDGKFSLTWDTPIPLMGEGLDENDLSYRLVRSDGVEQTVGSVKKFEESIPTGVNDLSGYSYTIYPMYRGYTYREATSNMAYIGYVDEHYSNDFNTEARGWEFTVEDVNKDDLTWEWTLNQKGYAMGGQSGRKKNDWLYTPGIRMKAGHTYPINFEAWRELVAYPEKIEVKAGLAPKAKSMTEVIAAPFEIEETYNETLQTDLYKHFTFTAPADGVYYIGIHACTNSAVTHVYVDNFSVDYSTVATTPAAVENFEVTPTVYGRLSAEISFDAPSKDITGNALAAIDEVVISRDDEVVKTLNVQPGEHVSYTDGVKKAGWYTYTVACKGDDTMGPRVSDTKHIGYDVPLPVDTLRANTSNWTRIVLDWDAVPSDVNGLAYAPNSVDYDIAVYQDGDMVKIADTKQTGAAFDNQNGEQFYYLFGVKPTAGGLTTDNYTYSRQLLVGQPYKLPFSESFSNAQLSHPWYIQSIYQVCYGIWSIFPDNVFTDPLDPYYGFKSADDDNGFVCYEGFFSDDWSQFFCGNITINSSLANPTLNFYHFTEPENQNTLEILVREPGTDEWTSLASYSMTGDKLGWKEEFLPLDEYSGKTIQIAFRANIVNASFVMFDGIRVYSRPEYNLNLNVKGEKKAVIGAPSQVTFTVKNNGLKDMNPAKLDMQIFGGDQKKTVDVPALKVGETFEAVYDYKLNSAAYSRMTLVGDIICPEDEYSADNRAMFNIETVKSDFPAPRDLTAVKNEDGSVDLEWTEPDPELYPVVGGLEDFESYAHQQTSDFGDWTVYSSGNAKLQFEMLEWPDLNGKVFGYVVFDTSVGDIPFIPYGYRAHSGNKFMATTYNQEFVPNDEWLVSPELDGKSRVIDFWASSSLLNWREDIEVLASTTGKEKEDFTIRLVYDFLVPAEWSNIKVTLPEGTKYVAIRSVANSKGMLMLDDINLHNGRPVEAEFLGYNIYRDGELLTKTPVKTLAYNDATAGDLHEYYVTALYDVAETPYSNAANIDVVSVGSVAASKVKVFTGENAIFVQAAAGDAIRVTDIAGSTLFRGKAADGLSKINVGAGVYVVNVGNAHVKVIVK